MAMMIRFGTAVLLLLAVVAFVATVASATEYIVGDDYGWRKDLDYRIWAEDKIFYVGDVLGNASCTLVLLHVLKYFLLHTTIIFTVLHAITSKPMETYCMYLVLGLMCIV